MLAPSATVNAPVMLPAYVNFWCQTSPVPVPAPDVSLFIHGDRRGEPDVQVCWRADLIEDERLNREQWCDVVSLLPPTAAECMSVPISRVRRWVAGDANVALDDGDLLGVPPEPEADPDGRDRGRREATETSRRALARLQKSTLLDSLRPNSAW